MTIDRDLVTRKMALIVEDLVRVEELARKDPGEYLSDDTAEVLAERYLERMIGRMIDINFHLITESGHPPPRDYYDPFVRLGGLKILPAKLASDMAGCAGLRNRIVHEYDDIEPTRVHGALRDAVRDMPKYLEHVREFVERGGS
ncbi:MAG: hypothetical protein QOD06_1540 [Candidatus Binatota bacterium]|nr:hypothetical protein [Candidatus Binatota bacterium]